MSESAKAARRRAKVAVIGDNTVDLYSGVSSEVFVGGNALNVAAQLACRDVDVMYFGAVGNDAYGGLIREALAGLGIDLRDLRIEQGDTATTNIELTETNDRVFVSFDYGVTGSYIPTSDELDRASEAEWVHIGMVPHPERVKAELRRRNPALVVSQDLSVTPGVCDLDVSFDSAAEAEDPKIVAAKSLAGGVPFAIVTLGARGAYATDGFNEWWQPSLAVNVIDTTGAGDSFAAGYIRARLLKADVTASLLSASEFAARTCSHVGGWQIPQEEETR